HPRRARDPGRDATEPADVGTPAGGGYLGFGGGGAGRSTGPPGRPDPAAAGRTTAGHLAGRGPAAAAAPGRLRPGAADPGGAADPAAPPPPPAAPPAPRAGP